MECSHCKKTDQIVAVESHGFGMHMRDATEYRLGCKACGTRWIQNKSWRDRSGRWDSVEYISYKEFDLLFPPKHMAFQEPQHDYDYYMKHGDIGKVFHVYSFGHPSHYIDPLDPKDRPEVARAFIMEWIADSDNLEYDTAFLMPDDFSTAFWFRMKDTGKRFKVVVPMKSHLVWDQNAKMFTVGTFTPKAMKLDLSGIGLLTMNYNILDRSKDKGAME